MEKNKFHSGPKVLYTEAKSEILKKSFTVSNASRSSQVCENLDRKIENEALDYLQRSEHRKMSRNTGMRKNITNMSPPSSFKGSSLSELLKKK